MEFIFHEKQSGSLCAQHCLNALLQGSYFTVFDLADIAKRLDESERRHMAEAGFNTNEYREFLKQPSSNFDDSGFFSIQVLVDALKVWNLELLPFTSSEEFCAQARDNPTEKDAFICNYREHWLTIRKIGHQWFNLNSILSQPELISDTYLTLFLKQLQMEGYSIFVVRGNLPACDADDILKLCPIGATPKAAKNQNSSAGGGGGVAAGNEEEGADDPGLKWALVNSQRMYDDDDDVLRRALEISILDSGTSSSAGQKSEPTNTSNRQEPVPAPALNPPSQPTIEELRQRRLQHLEKKSAGN